MVSAEAGVDVAVRFIQWVGQNFPGHEWRRKAKELVSQLLHLQMHKDVWPGWNCAYLFGLTCCTSQSLSDASCVPQRIGVLESAHSALQSLFCDQLLELPAEERTQARDSLSVQVKVLCSTCAFTTCA